MRYDERPAELLDTSVQLARITFHSSGIGTSSYFLLHVFRIILRTTLRMLIWLLGSLAT